ncbi:MAG: hypothetical protein AAF961_07975, partial [Planctomycetota bacterium]
MVIATSLAALGLTGVFATWSFLARMAVTPEAPASLQLALDAMDEGRFEDAKSMVGRLQRSDLSQEAIGGLLFVLGAAKSHEAADEWS